MGNITERIKAASGACMAETVLKNVKVINVFTQDIEVGDIALSGGKIVGIGEYDGRNIIDCTGLYAAPGFIDSHVHIESSMVTPFNLSKELLKHGVTTVIADPHEIANVLGAKGIDFMLADAENSFIDIFFMMPSCVPAVEFEDNGAVLAAEDLSSFKDNPLVLGLGEVMDVGSVLQCDKDMLAKLQSFENDVIDGHAPGLSGKKLNGYITAGVSTDHECENAAEAVEKVRRGMYVLIREGSAAKNLQALLPAVNEDNYHRFMFCTDDRHADDLLKEGSIDFVVRKAIEYGLSPVKALTLASFNAAACYGLKDRGALAPGYNADIVLFGSLGKIDMRYIVKQGRVHDIKNGFEENFELPERSHRVEHELAAINNMKVKTVAAENFWIKAAGKFLNVIEIIPGSLITRRVTCTFQVMNGYVSKVDCADIMKIAVFERHKGSGLNFTGYIKGFGLQNCSIAQTIAHDSHNIIVIGDNDNDMALAVNSLVNAGGGIALVSGGEVKAILKLPIGGLMSCDTLKDTAVEVSRLREEIKQFGRGEGDVFLTLSFMSLPVIPELKITPRGLFEYTRFNFINLFDK